MANGVIDTIMAGHASAEDLAAVGIGSSLWMPLFLFFMGMLGALQPIISGYNGAREVGKIMPATWQGPLPGRRRIRDHDPAADPTCTRCWRF